MKKETLETVTKQVLDERANQLSGQVRSALSQARHSAIDTAGADKKGWIPWGWGGMATAASIALLVSIWQPIQPLPTAEVFAFEEMKLMLSDDELELYEDLDFITWLDEVEQAG